MVADVLVGVLEQIGVRQIFGLIGDSLNPLGDAVRRSKIEWIGVRHEEGAALAAAGQAKLTGRLGVCAGTTGPGSTHLVAGLYEAARDHAPVLALSGDMVTKLRGIDYFQTTEPDLLFRDVSLYTETITSAAQAPSVIHQAIAAAYAGPGVAHLTLPLDVMAAKAEGEVTSVATLRPHPEFAASAADITAIARQIDAAANIVIMCGNGCHGAADELRALSDRLKAPLNHSFKGKDIMPFDDPHWMGGIGMVGTKAVYNAIMQCDLLLMFGTDYPFSEFLPHKGAVIQIDERASVLGRRTPTAPGVMGSVRPTVKLLLDQVAAKSDGSFFEHVTSERRKWDAMLDKQADPKRSRDRIHPQAVARAASDAAKHDAVFVIDTGLNTLWSGNWIRQSGSQADLGVLQQLRRRDCARSGQRHPGARPLAAGHRPDRRRRFQHADGRVPDGSAPQAAGEGRRLQQFEPWTHCAGSRGSRSAGVPGGDRIPESGFRRVCPRLRRPWFQGGTTGRAARRDRRGLRRRRARGRRLRRRGRRVAEHAASRPRARRPLCHRENQGSRDCGHRTVTPGRPAGLRE